MYKILVVITTLTIPSLTFADCLQNPYSIPSMSPDNSACTRIGNQTFGNDVSQHRTKIGNNYIGGTIDSSYHSTDGGQTYRPNVSSSMDSSTIIKVGLD